MTSFLERYQQGEYLPVWADLQRLGEQIRREPLWSDALAVARETMRRARFNIELLIPRLQASGYAFGDAWLEELAKDDRMKAWATEHLHGHDEFSPAFLADVEATAPDPVKALKEWKALDRQSGLPFAPPRAATQQCLAELEDLVGPIPLSVRAWYEVVGQVNFVGQVPERWKRPAGSSMPTHQPRPARGPDDPSSLALLEEEGTFQEESGVEIGPDDLFSLALLEEYQKPPFDPVYVEPIEEVLHRVKVAYSPENPWLDVSPDSYGKYFTSGSGPYGISVPNPTMDGLLEGEWHETTFVNYLRICFAWAGLPGLTYFEQQGQEDLRILTAGLFPL